MAKTVAARAAELGVDQRELIRALKALGWNKTRSGKTHWSKNSYNSYGRWLRDKVPQMSKEQAALLLGVDLKDAEREVKKTRPRTWTRAQVLDAMFAFHKEHGRFPRPQEYKVSAGLPSRRQWMRIGWALFNSWDVSAPDAWERRIAQDRRCTPQIAVKLRNALARREAIERIGFDKFIKRGLVELVDEHPEYGALYRLAGENADEPMLMLKVVNSTPEPDGSFADYYLRVPPTMTDVREALRWTFGGDEMLGSQPYEPLVQT